jgi:single-stranded DNA-binding protein
MNNIILQGQIIDDITFSHESYNEKFYRFTLNVKRNDITEDVIPIEASEYLIKDIQKNDFVSITGNIRTQNVLEGERKRLYVKVFAKRLSKCEEGYRNEVELQGVSVKPIILRHTKSEKDICDVCLAIKRSYNKTDYIPVIIWNRQANLMSTLDVYSTIKIKGRLQSRYYCKKNENNEITEERTVLEVSVYELSIVE